MSGRYPAADDYRAVESRLSDYARRRGVSSVSLGSVLGTPARAELMLPHDSSHPTPEGHRLVAAALAPLVR